ncbi:MAG: HAMP domain-containing histidine kinase [Oscillospiraceae bacterium]|nr:HAMP domain-containing histidine kinase [Oscillospiraceae bacterium]
MKKTRTNRSRFWRGSFRTIYWRHFALMVGVVLLTMLLLGVSFFSISYGYVRTEKVVDMREKAERIAEMSAGYLSGHGVQDGSLRQLALFAASVSSMDFHICDAGGNIRLSTDRDLAGMVVRVPQNIVYTALQTGEYSGNSSLGGLYESTRFVVAVDVRADGEAVGLILAVTGIESLTAVWRAFFSIFFMTAFTVLFIAFIASAWLSMRQSKPIREMAAATRSFAEGNFDARMQRYDEVEIDELAAAFNSMADSLQETERQRREFIANVSHELKTPMTTIAGYTDGILDGTIPPEQEEQYLRIISDESRRLSRLVRRMLDVSRLQSVDPLRTRTQFDLCESARRVLLSMEKKITDRALDVQADIPDEPLLVLGDNDLITQAIYNLLENAAKFARAGTSIYFGIGAQNKKAVVTVRNLGDTIPAEEIPRIFERFHKSDKSRSEDKDGVGLGLYIVRTIIEQHKEHIAVTSEDGVTTFAFTVQLAGGQQ